MNIMYILCSVQQWEYWSLTSKSVTAGEANASAKEVRI